MGFLFKMGDVKILEGFPNSKNKSEKKIAPQYSLRGTILFSLFFGGRIPFPKAKTNFRILD